MSDRTRRWMIAAWFALVLLAAALYALDRLADAQ